MPAPKARTRKYGSLPFLSNIPGLRVILLGPPASGKGTVARTIHQNYGLVHVSSGELLRKRKSTNREIREAIENGKLVSDEIVTRVVMERLRQRDCMQRGWILDGFPRTPSQALLLKEAGILDSVDCVIVLKVSDETVIDRIEGRRMDPLTGDIYHLTNYPPPASNHDLIARLVQRSDDTAEKAEYRLVQYYKYAQDVIDICQADEPACVQLVNSGDDAALVYARTIHTLGAIQTTRVGDRRRWVRHYQRVPELLELTPSMAIQEKLTSAL